MSEHKKMKLFNATSRIKMFSDEKCYQIFVMYISLVTITWFMLIRYPTEEVKNLTLLDIDKQGFEKMLPVNYTTSEIQDALRYMY